MIDEGSDDMARKLTPQQKKFADNYIKTGNYYQSARDAGYTHNYASRADYLLDIVGVKKHIEKQMDKISKPTIASAEEILQYLTAVVRAEIKEKAYKTVEGEVIAMELDPDIKDRTKAAELLGKRYGVFIDKLDANVTIHKGLEDYLGDD